MGRLTNLNPAAPIADSDIPQSITRDSELAAHTDGGNPHPQYLSETEAFSQYEFKAALASKQLAGARTFPANTWTSLGNFPTFSLGVQGSPSAIIVAIGFCFDINSPWQQACCAALLGPIWWQPVTTADQGARVWLEVHNQTGFFLSIRCGGFSGDLRPIVINPESPITIPSTGRVDVSLKRFL